MTTQPNAAAGASTAEARSEPAAPRTTARWDETSTPPLDGVAERSTTKSPAPAGGPDICILTKLQYTDTPVRTEHGTLVRTAQWLQDAVDRDGGGPGSRIENPLGNLLDDERRQTVVPERRPRLLELMDRMADGRAVAPNLADETELQAMKDAVRALHAQIAADHAERPLDCLLYELN